MCASAGGTKHNIAEKMCVCVWTAKKWQGEFIQNPKWEVFYQEHN